MALPNCAVITKVLSTVVSSVHVVATKALLPLIRSANVLECWVILHQESWDAALSSLIIEPSTMKGTAVMLRAKAMAAPTVNTDVPSFTLMVRVGAARPVVRRQINLKFISLFVPIDPALIAWEYIVVSVVVFVRALVAV